MLADLDLLLISVFCAADDLLPTRAGNGRRMLTDAEVVTLAVAQAMMGIPSDERFLAAARTRLSHLFPVLPQRPGYHKRRQRLSDTIEALIAVFARDSPGFHDDLVLVDSTPIECRLRLQRRPQPLLLGLPTARPVRARRHPARAQTHISENTRARGLPPAARPARTRPARHWHR
jgi:hypothetical protein